MRSHYNNDDATFRPEWSKGGRSVRTRTPTTTSSRTRWRATYIEGVPTTENWDTARARYNQIDPHRVFTNGFMDKLLP